MGSVPTSAEPARAAGTSLAKVPGRRSELCRSSSTSGTVEVAEVSAVYRSCAAEAIEAVRALDNVLYPIGVLKRCWAQ